MVSVSICSVLVLLAIMMFSPLAVQFDDEGPAKGAASYYEIDSLMEAHNYQRALWMVDSAIADNGDGLHEFPYFDRFFSDEDYYESLIRRAEIYDLQWKRMEIEMAIGETENLKRDLKRYSRIVGCHLENAKAMLDRINE